MKSNHDVFESAGNPWATPEDWTREVSLAQNPLTATAERNSALAFVRPAPRHNSLGRLPDMLPELKTPLDESGDIRFSKEVLSCRNRIAFLKGAPDFLAPITEEVLHTFRVAVSKVTPVPSGEIGWDVDVDRVRNAHAIWLADEKAKIEARRQLVLARKAALAAEEEY